MTTPDPTHSSATGEEPPAPLVGPQLNAQTRLLLDRRNLLRVTGMVALAGGGAAALAACSPAQTPTAAPSPAETTSAAPSSARPTAAPSSASPSSAPSSAASSTKSAPVPKGPSVNAADVAVGGGVIMKEPDNYVVTQPKKGDYKAFTAICTHQGCRVSELRGDKIYCPCHGSEFSITDGAAVGGPAQEPLKEFKTTVAGGKVVVDA